MKIRYWLPLTICVASLSLLIYCIDDPFGLKFWIPLYCFLSSISLGLLVFAKYLLTKKSLILKLITFIPGLAGVFFLFVIMSLLIDYRLLLPGFRISNPRPLEWQQDLTALKAEFLKHPIFKDSLDSAILNDVAIGDGNDDECLVAMMRLAGKIPDGHTFVHPFQPAIRATYFPLQGYWFADGFYIVRAANRYQKLVGKKIISINGVAIEDLLKKINELHGPENDWEGKSQFNLFVWSTNVLHGLGITNNMETCRLEYLDSGRQTIELKSEPFFTWFFWYLKPISENVWSPAYSNLRKPNYSIRYDSSIQCVVFVFNLIKNESGKSIDALADELDEMIHRHPGKIIVDLRNNTGGDNTLYNKLVSVIAKESKQRKIYFLVGRRTFSAAVNFISEVNQNGKVILVGEPTGAGPNHYGDSRHVLLPKTKISLFISTRKWQFDSLDSRKYYTPDIPVNYLFKDHQSNIDPWVNAVGHDY